MKEEMKKTTELHVIKVTRAEPSSFFAVGRELTCLPPERGRYDVTPSISIPVADVQLLAVRREEEK